ncbi:WYL domain-containing protein [Cetobacterium somerae]|uniref:WYL domain-containing protein n=1 Tax=Cetobacterium sp. NK01 TaxID=2993530 RepID=UPI002116EF2B|nr:WYL domain-containing protein [Cetobacterium sp. NK01]MCQ8212505.1 WYL domain-containing protein [Cetobacterium sp. NK01]
MKKVRVTVSEDIWRLLKKDSEEFGINNNKLCNFILDKFKYTKKFDIDKLIEPQGRPLKKVVQFDLNVANKSIYYDILKANNVDIEAEFFRELFELYSSQFKYQREIFIFQDTYKVVLEAIKNKVKIRVLYMEESLIISPYFIKREDQGDENFIFSYDDENKIYRSIKLKDVIILGVLNEKIQAKDKKYIENMRKNFDPFLGERLLIKAVFTPVGESMLKSFTNYKPKFIKKDENIYQFEMTLENAKFYFASFLKEVNIIEPEKLREELKKSFLEAYKIYENKSN